MTDWGDLVARARGLSTHLLDAERRRAIAECRDMAALSVSLAAEGILPAPLERAGARTLELGVRRHAARKLRMLWRWAGERAPRLAPLIEDEDRRSIRAMLRGASSGNAPDVRLAGLVPTPSLPERALQDLARRGDIASVGAQLAAMGNPYGRAILDEALRQYPDLMKLESALNATYAARATAAGVKADDALRAHVQGILDVENFWTAWLLPAGTVAAEHAELFVEGGGALSRAAWGAAVAATTAAVRDEILARVAAPPWLAAAVAGAPGSEDVVLRAMILHQHRLGRQEPLGTAPVIEYVLRLREEVRALQRIIWSMSLRVPSAALVAALERRT